MATHNHQIKRLMTSATKRANPWLCFTAEADNSTIRLDKVGSPDAVSLETSPDGKTWTAYMWSGNTGATITLASVGDKVYWRATSTNYTFSKAGSNTNYYLFRSGTGSRYSVTGTLLSLLDRDCNVDEIPANAFVRLFQSSEASDSPYTAFPRDLLKARDYGANCFAYLFMKCGNAVSFPDIPSIVNTNKDILYGAFSNSSIQSISLPDEEYTRSVITALLQGCGSINRIKVNFKSWTNSAGQEFCVNWCQDYGGVTFPQRGIFECPDELPEIFDSSHIPTGWTVVKPSDGYIQDGLVFQLDAKRGKTSSTWTDIKGAVELAISNDVATGLEQAFPEGYTIEICAEQRVPLVGPPYSLESWESISINFGEEKAALALKGYQGQQVQIISTGEIAYIYTKLLIKTNEGEFDAGYGQGLREGDLTIVSAQTTGETAYIKNEAKTLDSAILTTFSGTRIERVHYIKSIRVYSRALTDTERFHNYNLDKQRFG